MLRLLLDLLSHRLRMGPILARWIPRLAEVHDECGTMEDLDKVLRDISRAEDMPSPVTQAMLCVRYNLPFHD